MFEEVQMYHNSDLKFGHCSGEEMNYRLIFHNRNAYSSTGTAECIKLFFIYQYIIFLLLLYHVENNCFPE